MRIQVAPFAFDTIWGSTQLYKTYLATLEYLLQFDWDFYINLSASKPAVHIV